MATVGLSIDRNLTVDPETLSDSAENVLQRHNKEIGKDEPLTITAEIEAVKDYINETHEINKKA